MLLLYCVTSGERVNLMESVMTSILALVHPLTTISTEKTFRQDFLEILKQNSRYASLVVMVGEFDNNHTVVCYPSPKG